MKSEEQTPQTDSSTKRPSLFSTHWEATEESENVVNYRQWSILAMLSLVLGTVSLVAFLYSSCLFLPILGVPMALVAYFRIKRSDGVLLGSFAAQAGLFLSTLTLVGVSVMWPYYQYTVRREADRFFRIWFDAAKTNNIRQVIEMRSPTWHRKLDADMETWWKSKLDHKGEMAMEMISTFQMSLNEPHMRTLWALGDRADISYYKTTWNHYHDAKDTVTSIYAVTVAQPDNPNDRETFFLTMSAERTKNPNDETQFGWALKGPPAIVKELPR